MASSTGTQSTGSPTASASRLAAKALLALALWMVLTEGEWRSLIVGLPVIALAVAASHWLDRGHGRGIRVSRLPAFVWYFISRSLLAGLDVAWRTRRPQAQLNPSMTAIPMAELPTGTPSWLLAVTISLLPGSLYVESRGGVWTLHCLDDDTLEADITEARRQVARLFAIEPREHDS